ncbi:hypothetical protein ACJJIP_21590 [Microbulbifer sp. VTAC004]
MKIDEIRDIQSQLKSRKSVLKDKAKKVELGLKLMKDQNRFASDSRKKK